jgi:hypothetical protein
VGTPGPFRWTPAALADLGRRSDLDIARRLRVHTSTVSRKREELGLAPFRGRVQPILRTPALKTLLRRTGNRALREKHGLSAFVITKLRREFGIRAPGAWPKRWSREAVARLGKESDTALAKALGITPGAVHYKRRSLGIPRFDRRRRWTTAERRLLGRVTDAELARRLGLHQGMVGKMRHGLGIPRASRGRKRRLA